MKLCYLIAISILLILSSCLQPKPNSWSDKDYKFTIEYCPSFLQDSRIILESKDDTQTLTFYKLRRDTLIRKAGSQRQSTDSLIHCLMSDIKSGETIFIEKIDSISISKHDHITFKEALNNVDLRKQKNLIKEGILDGVTVFLRFQNESEENIFGMRCPRAADSTEFKIIQSMFSLIDSSFNSNESDTYFNNLKEYF